MYVVVHEHLMTDDTSKSVEERGEVLPSTSPDNTEDLYNSGVTTCIVNSVGVYGATTLKRRVAGSIVIAVKILVGVPNHILAVKAMNSAKITEESKEKGSRPARVDTDGE